MLKFVYSDKNPAAPVAYCAFEAMHTKIEVLFVHADRDTAEAICTSIEEETNRIERQMSRHLSDSPLHELNSKMDAVHVPDDLYFILELSEQLRKSTAGYFDIAALSTTRERPAYRTYPPQHLVQRASADVMLDLGGIAKGYAIEKAKTLLAESGVRKALLNFGNSSVLGIGTHPCGDCWEVSPENAADELVFRLNDSALSISGKGSFGRDHIVDPHTLKTVSKSRNIAVTGRSALICEVLSTALYAADEKEVNNIMTSFEGYETYECRQ